jgi:fatty acid desaturase
MSAGMAISLSLKLRSLYAKPQKYAKGRGEKTASFLFALWVLLFALFLCCAVAGAGHGAVGTIAAAGGFALFLIFYEAEYYQRHDNGKYEAYYNGCDIV